MGRASNPAVPQRVAAKVVPKAPSFAEDHADDEDEKTMIESGWEDEASTTVEQGDVAEKLRALGAAAGEAAKRSNTNITSTNGGSPEEPTVDDQRVSGAMALLPPPVSATLVITLGNDKGKSLEVRAGKTYTVGRGMDNDLVLTDIAVSRKHFDIRHDNGAWIVADRGSGNGTLVNNHIEDAPFTLANEDVIEIGNTAFRFDLAGGEPRRPATFEAEDDLEVRRASVPRGDADTPPAGPPVAPPVAPSIGPNHSPGRIVPAASSLQHAQTAPLPRPRAPTTRPLVGYAIERPGAQSQAMQVPQVALGTAPPPVALGAPVPAAAGTLSSPMSGVAATTSGQMAALAAPSAASTLQGSGPAAGPGQSAAGRAPGSLLEVPANPVGVSGMPTLQGTGAGIPPARSAFSRGEPGIQATVTRGSGAPHAALDLTSTSRVQPIDYASGGARPVEQTRTLLPLLTPRMKLAIAGGFMLVVALVAIAVIVGSDTERPTPSPAVRPDDLPPDRPTYIQPPPERSRPALEAPTKPKPAPIPAKPGPVKPAAAAVASPSDSAPSNMGSGTTSSATAPVMAAPAKPGDKPLPSIARPAIIEKSADKPSDKPTPAPVTADKPKIADKPAPAKPEVAAPKVDPRKAPAKRIEPRKPEKPEKKREAETDKIETAAPAKVETKRRSVQEVKADAAALYRAKNFTGAAGVVGAAVPGQPAAVAQELKTLASIYSGFGKDYAAGMNQGTKVPEAYAALIRARGYDRALGGAYLSEIEPRLANVAARAALSFTASKEYDSAFQAVRTSESLGSTSATNKSVRDKLVELATDLVRTAQSEQASNPEEAKKKLRQVLGIVDDKHPLHIKASKLLGTP